jgi:hypothetical protein
MAKLMAWGGLSCKDPSSNSRVIGPPSSTALAMRRVTGWRLPLRASMVQRRSQSAEPGTAGRIMIGFLPTALPAGQTLASHRGHQRSSLGRPGRDRADLRDPHLDRAELQAGQRRAWLSRLPGPLRYRDPPPGPGQRRVPPGGPAGSPVPRPRKIPPAPRPEPGRGERAAACRLSPGILAPRAGRDTRLAHQARRC